MTHLPHLPHLSIHKPKIFKNLKVWRAFAKSFKEFLSKTSIHAYYYMVEPNRHILERSMWIFVHLSMVISAVYIVLFAWSRFTDNPTITTLESQHYSIFNLDFPAVAICPNNKLRYANVEQYVDYLLQSPNLPEGYQSKGKLINLTRFMGRLYDADIEGIDEFGTFQDILDAVDSNKTTGIFDSRELLRRLAPKCEDILMTCKWGGKFFNCSEMIHLRATSEGFCCTFNYIKPENHGALKGPKALAPAGIGPDMGLTVLLNLSSANYFYPLKNFIGVTAMIFDPEEYADPATGGVRVVSIIPFQETRVTLNMVTKIAVDDVQRYGIEKRECMFPNDLLEEYHGNYVYGDCLVKCKLKSVIALCKCKLFNMPTDFDDVDADDWPYCSLSSIACLNKYRIKWQTYKPREKIAGLEREIEDSLDCTGCYPLCSSNIYIVDSTSTQLNFYYENRGSVISNLSESRDLSVLKVYFPQVDSVLYSTTVLYAWYDVVSDYGGILGLCLGCSIMSFIELVYFLTVRFYQNLFNRSSFLTKFNQKPKANMFGPGKMLYRSKFEYIK